MHSSPKILLVDDRFELASLKNYRGKGFEAVIGLFWMAPSTQRYLSRMTKGPCYGLPDLITDDQNWSREAYHLILRMISVGPYYGDLPWRSYLAEPLYREGYTVHLLFRTAEFIDQLKQKWSVSRIIIEGTLPENISSPFVQILSRYSGLTYQPWGVSQSSSARDNGQIPLWKRFRQRLQEALLTGDWRKQFLELAEWMDPTYRRRIFWGGRKRGVPVGKGGITFFSSYQNNSRNLSPFADLMPDPVTWVLTNYSARRGLACRNSNYTWIWKYEDTSRSSLRAVDEGIYRTEEGGSNSLPWLEIWLAKSLTWEKWRTAELPLLTTLTSCWEKYLDQAEPRLVVMAHQWGIEGWFTQIARRRGITVLQVMHGVLGGHLYTQTPILSSTLVVCGNFWRDLWREDQRSKILVNNPEGWIQKGARQKSTVRRSLTFFSWPISQSPFYNFYELMDGFIHIFERIAKGKKYRINIRVHPGENPFDFIQRWRHLYGSLPSEIHLTKDDPLSQTLADTDVALMFRSTVMLNCMANNIPVVIPGWIDFGWNKALKKVSGIHLADDFNDLEERLIEYLEDPPQISRETVEPFVKSSGTGEGGFSLLIEDLLRMNGTSASL
jgi:hypothetical protein